MMRLRGFRDAAPCEKGVRHAPKPRAQQNPGPIVLARLLLGLGFVCIGYARAEAQEYRTLNLDGATQTYVADVNDAGAIVGSFYSGGQFLRGFVRQGEQVTVLEYEGGEGTQALGVNNRGDVVGWIDFDTDPGPEQFIVQRGFRWSSGQFTLLSDSPRVLPYDINDAGTIVGLYDVTESPARGFILRSGQSAQAVSFPGLGGYLSGINDADVAVGVYTDSAFQSVPIRHIAGVTSPLDLTSVAPSDCAVPLAFRISDAGSYTGNCQPPRPDGGVDSFAILGSSFQRIAFPGAVSTGAGGINSSGTVVGNYTAYDPVIADFRSHGFIARRVELLDPLPDLRKGNAIT